MSSPFGELFYLSGVLAQPVEQNPVKVMVAGSSPAHSVKYA